MFQDGSDRSALQGAKTSSRQRAPGARGARSKSAHPHTSAHQPEPRRKPSDSLASNDFTYCLTLFPKCFSSFPHGTCSLSVSRQYLALEGFYLPLHAAFPSNATRRKRANCGADAAEHGIFTLSDSDFHHIIRKPAPLTRQDYNSQHAERGAGIFD